MWKSTENKVLIIIIIIIIIIGCNGVCFKYSFTSLLKMAVAESSAKVCFSKSSGLYYKW